MMEVQGEEIKQKMFDLIPDNNVKEKEQYF